MRKSLVLLPLALLAVALPAAHAEGKVEVAYVTPEKFTDVGFGSVERARTLRAMTEVLTGLGARLPDGQTLKLEVTDINLAGELRPGRGDELRVMRGMADWPEIKLRYTLQAGATTLKSGEADIHDFAYLQGSSTLETIGTNLPYERRMLRKWFAETFGKN